MTTLRVGTTQKYAQGWELAFGKKSGSKTMKKVAAKSAPARKSPAKKKSAKGKR